MELIGDPTVDIIPSVRCDTCGKVTGKYHDSFIWYTRGSGDPKAEEKYFNRMRIKRTCCRTTIAHPIVIPAGRSLYDEELVKGRKEMASSATGGAMPSRPVLPEPMTNEQRKQQPPRSSVIVSAEHGGYDNLITVTRGRKRGAPLQKGRGGMSSVNAIRLGLTPAGTNPSPPAEVQQPTEFTMHGQTYKISSSDPLGLGIASTRTVATPAPTAPPSEIVDLSSYTSSQMLEIESSGIESNPVSTSGMVIEREGMEAISRLPRAPGTATTQAMAPESKTETISGTPLPNLLMGVTGCIIPKLRPVGIGQYEIDPEYAPEFKVIEDMLGQVIEPRIFTGKYKDVGCGLRVPILTGTYKSV